jgi:hypothetical protein
MTDNVILLGAGASIDAGVPLLNNFVDKMRYYASKGKSSDRDLTDSEILVLKKAIEIMNDLDSYHGRAAFDDRNLEDLLSILAFNIIGGERFSRLKLEQMIEAISCTIELSCNIKHDGGVNKVQRIGNPIYRDFWSHLFSHYNLTSSFPTIITLNYDLVLERSLLQALISDEYYDHRFDGVIIDYHYQGIPSKSYRLKTTKFRKLIDGDITYSEGITIDPCEKSILTNPLIIDLLKLHGSVNFPNISQYKSENEIFLTSPTVKPFIIPPISNKSLSKKSERMWKFALDSIQECKNLYIVGYSLPRTDIYFQFFLKSALGPNKDFNKIIVYNPELFTTNGKSEIETRYSECFPQQLLSRIEFRPSTNNNNIKPGSFESFIKNMSLDNFFY